jgi:hypothetical protein
MNLALDVSFRLLTSYSNNAVVRGITVRPSEARLNHFEELITVTDLLPDLKNRQQ